MNHADPETIKNINRAGLEEFLNKGFEGASLRNIVRNAGVTTGAFYGYYPGKEALFDMIVKDAYEGIKAIFSDPWIVPATAYAFHPIFLKSLVSRIKSCHCSR